MPREQKSSRDTYPESYITQYTSVQRLDLGRGGEEAARVLAEHREEDHDHEDGDQHLPIHRVDCCVDRFNLNAGEIIPGSMRNHSMANDMSCTDRYSSQFQNNYFADMCSGSEAGSYLRLIDFCITQL